MSAFQSSARIFNKLVEPLLRGPLKGALGGSMAVVSYTGRKSGKAVQLPIAYKKQGDVVTIAVALPDQKSWWKNFLGEGAPLTIDLPGGPRSGPAVATRDERGGVKVHVALEPAT